MCLSKFTAVIIFAILLDCYALNCHSDGGMKDEELKAIYKNCLKKQDEVNSDRNDSGISQEPREHNQKPEWDDWDERHRDSDNKRRDRDDRRRNKDDKSGDREDERNRNKKNNMGRSYNDRDVGSRDYYNNNRDYNDYSNRDFGSENKDYSLNRGDGSGMRKNSGSMENGNNRYGKENVPQNNEYGMEFSNPGRNQFNSYQPTSNSPRRYRREKRPGMNSGQRSQYNPNTSTLRTALQDSKSHENSTDKLAKRKACALHCFMENLEMIGEDGKPDKYLVTHRFMKEAKNEDMKDFLQESVEECFQILDNENTEDKCDFSKNILMCLSEKGKANCDDWKDEMF